MRRSTPSWRVRHTPRLGKRGVSCQWEGGTGGRGDGRRDTGGGALVGCPSGQREQTVNLPASAHEGSNPSPTTRHAGVAQLVEHQPSKLRVAGSSPVARSVARVAQSVERALGKDEVTGSIPVASFRNRKAVTRERHEAT